MERSVTAIVEKKGYFWWLGEEMPGGRFAPKNALPGVLTISEDGLSTIVITGSLMRSSILQLDKKARLDAENSPDALKDRTIVGKVDEDQRCVYLRNVVYKHPGRTIDGRVSETFNAGFCLIGNSATPLDPPSFSFSRLSISLKGLEEWRRNESISVNAPQEDGLDHSQIVNWAIEQKEYSIESGRICLRTDIHCNGWDAVKTRDITFHQYDWLDYAPEAPTSPELLKQEFGRIEEFLALLIGNYYNLDWPLISTGESGSIESYTLYFFRNKGAASPLEIQDLWTIFPQIREQFGVLYETAKRIRQEYGAGFYLRLAALRSASMYIEHRFMNLIWGIEQLHRTLHPDAKGPSSDYETIQNLFGKIQEQLNADSRRWFKRQLEFATEPQLKQRIVESFAGLPWQIESASLNRFAERCAARRNDISHYGGPRKDKKESYEDFLLDLMKLSDGLSYLYHAALLQGIGLDANTLRQCLTNMPIGWRIRAGLVQAGLKVPPSPHAYPQVEAVVGGE